MAVFRKNTNPDKSQDGFSILEILVVLVVISVSLAALGSRFTNNEREVSPREYAHTLQSLFVRERLKAITSGQATDIVFDFGNRSKKMRATDFEEILPDELSFEILTGRELVLTPRLASIRFFPDGSSIGGVVSISSNRFEKAIIKINWLTGIASIKESRGQ